MFGFDDHEAEIGRLQALRATPPGLATDVDRQRVFGAALQQFDELLAAGRDIGVSSAPLPTFYALSQAGRAIAAARCSDERWDFKGHGLHIHEDTTDIGQSVVAPQGSRGTDAFSVVGDATGSSRLSGPVTLGALWGSLPHLGTAVGLGQRAPRALHLAPRGGHHPSTVGDLRIASADIDQNAWRDALKAYPAAETAQLADWTGYSVAGTRMELIGLYWVEDAHRGKRADIRDTTQPYLGDTDTYLWPAVGQRDAVLSPLMTWWAVLLVLSQLARYAPAAWTAALDKDNSPLAVPIELGLRHAQRVLPRLVLHAITGSWR